VTPEAAHPAWQQLTGRLAAQDSPLFTRHTSRAQRLAQLRTEIPHASLLLKS